MVTSQAFKLKTKQLETKQLRWPKTDPRTPAINGGKWNTSGLLVGQMTDRQTQRLDFAVCPDGSVEMKHHDCDVTAIGPISRDQFTDDKIEMAIADLLDRLVP